MRWAGHVARTAEKFKVGFDEKKRWEERNWGNLEVGKEIIFTGRSRNGMAVVEWIDLASDTDKWRAVVRGVGCGQFPDQLDNCYVIKMDSAPCSQLIMYLEKPTDTIIYELYLGSLIAHILKPFNELAALTPCGLTGESH